MYREFFYEKTPPTSVLALDGMADRGVLIDSISKRYSACGARIGALITRNRDLSNAFLRLGQARLCPPTLEQVGALRLLALGPDYHAGVQREYRMRRDAVVDALQAMPGVLCERPAGAFYVMARLPVDDTEDFARWMLTSFADRAETVMVAPGPGFYATPGAGHDEIRIAYVLEVPKLKRAMELLQKGMETYAARTS